ncbi:MAG: hypothetical protein WAL97_06040 [Halobacteriota archaeon]
MPFGKPPLSVKYAVLKQPLAPPEFTCPIDWPFIRTVTVPPQTVIPYEVTGIAKFIGFPFVKVGMRGLFKPVAAIDVGILPDAGGTAVGVALALGDGLTAADELAFVVVDAVVDDVLELDLATCGLV